MSEMNFWQSRRVCVTGGAGFLGSFVVAELHRRGAKEVFVPRSSEYSLVEVEAVRRLLRDSQPGPGDPPGCPCRRHRCESFRSLAEFFYDNLMMSTQLLHECRKQGVEKFVGIGTVCAYPKFTPIPFREEDLWNGYPGRKQCAVLAGAKDAGGPSQVTGRRIGYMASICTGHLDCRGKTWIGGLAVILA